MKSYYNIFQGKRDEVLKKCFIDFKNPTILTKEMPYNLGKKTKKLPFIAKYYNELKNKDYLDIKRIERKTDRKGPAFYYAGRLNLRFLQDSYFKYPLKFSKTELAYLKEIFEWKGVRGSLNKELSFTEAFRDLLIRLVGFSISSWKEEVKDYETTNMQHIEARTNYYLSLRISTSTMNEQQIYRFVKKLKKHSGDLYINELICCMPYTLIIKILRNFIPFTIAGELIREDIEKIKGQQWEDLAPKGDAFLASVIKKPYTNIQRKRKEVLESFSFYEKQKSEELIFPKVSS